MHLGELQCAPAKADRSLRPIFLLMRITNLILLLGAIHMSALAFSQEKITLSEKNAPLEKVLGDIQKQTTLNIWYQKQILSDSKPVSIDVKNASVSDALTQCLEHQPLEFEIIGNNVNIRRRTSWTTPAPPTSLEIHGKVFS